ncbi:MAG: HPP family protein [Solirubrobacterales bacterium]
MSRSIVKQTVREVAPLRDSDTVGFAVRRVVDAGLPALPVIDAQGRFSGIFGEREFMAALFPGYVSELASARMIRRSIDETIERRAECRAEPIARHMTTDPVLVEEDYSDTEIAEIFLHHRVLIVPIATGGRVRAVVTRSDFFSALVERFARAGGTRPPED